MKLEFITSVMQAAVLSERARIEKAYELLPESTRFWGMIDLVGSANFRLAKGPKEGYVRAETFFSVIRTVIGRRRSPEADLEVRLIKEMGDAVFLRATELRPLLESMIVIDQVIYQLAVIAGSEQYPFAIRGAIGYGTAKEIVRRNEDYLGHPIDRLSRIMSVRSNATTILLDEQAHCASGEFLQEYAAFLDISGPMHIGEEARKGMHADVCYREVKLNRSALRSFERNFVAWRHLETSTSDLGHG
jgi:class 3 adenylate cyclase